MLRIHTGGFEGWWGWGQARKRDVLRPHAGNAGHQHLGRAVAHHSMVLLRTSYVGSVGHAEERCWAAQSPLCYWQTSMVYRYCEGLSIRRPGLPHRNAT